MLTRKQAAEQRRAIQRDIERDHKKKARAKLVELRAKVREAHASKKARMKELSERCRADRLTVRGRLLETRQRILRELRETARVEREAARQSCILRKRAAKDECDTEVERTRAELAAERTYQMDLRRIERDNRTKRVAHTRATRKAHRGESDEAVLQDIPSDLHALFHRVKRSIKATPRMSRSEAFLKYAEENPHDVFEVIEQKTDRMIRELESQHAQAARAAMGPNRARMPPRVPRRTYTAAELAAVPF